MLEAKSAEEQACGLYSFDGRDLSAEMEELCVRVARVEEERAAEAGELAALVVEASIALVDLWTLPIQELPLWLLQYIYNVCYSTTLDRSGFKFKFELFRIFLFSPICHL
jgi:hypothetical protein